MDPPEPARRYPLARSSNPLTAPAKLFAMSVYRQLILLGAIRPTGQSILESFWIDVAAGMFVSAVLATMGIGFYRVMRRRRVGSFFGIHDSNRLRVYVSRLGVQKFTTTGLDGQPRSFSGEAVAGNEFRLTAEIEQFFFRLGPALFRSIVRWIDIGVEAEISPEDPHKVDSSDGIICIGSSAYNAASLGVELHPQSRARLHAFGAPVECGAPGRTEATYTDPGVCFVQRVQSSNGQVRLEAAGLSIEGTDAATHYLLTHFRELERGYRGTERFCVVLRVTASGVNVLRRTSSPSR